MKMIGYNKKIQDNGRVIRIDCNDGNGSGCVEMKLYKNMAK